MAKQKVEPQIVVNITPYPLPDAPAYAVSRDLNDRERQALALAWGKMNKEQDTTRFLFLLPEGTDLRALHTEHLKNLRKGIDEALKERGVDVTTEHERDLHVRVVVAEEFIIHARSKEQIAQAVQMEVSKALRKGGVI